MSAPHDIRITAAGHPTDAPAEQVPGGEFPAARLRLEPTGSARTLLDGGWWPRSADPVATTATGLPAQRPWTGPTPPAQRAPVGDVHHSLTKEQPMTVARQRIIDTLRARGQHARADWITQELPEQVDLAKHVGLLATLRIDPAELVEAP
jgi:hypothetical protein